MKLSIKSLLAALVVSLSLAAPVLAGPFEDGSAASNRGDYATALRLWRPLAEQGVAGAQYNMAGMYEKGEGVPQDDVKAHKWLNLAAAQGQQDAGILTRKSRTTRPIPWRIIAPIITRTGYRSHFTGRAHGNGNRVKCRRRQ